MISKKQKTLKGSMFVVLLLLIPSMLYAACTGSSPTWTSTPDSTSVQSCVNRASAGDTINVSAGSATWSANAIEIPADKPLKLIGAGGTSTQVTLSGNNVITVAPYVGTTSLPATRISGFYFISPSDANYKVIFIQGQGWRIDNNRFYNIQTTGTTGAFFVQASGINTSIQPYGLIDNNTIINGKIDVAGQSSYAGQAAAWADALDLGGASAVYIEDNNFSTDYPTIKSKRLMVDNGYAAKYVLRYNTISNGDVGAHSLQSVGDRGSRKTETYGNIFNHLNDCVQISIGYGSGTGVVFGNSFTGVASGYVFGFENVRSDTSVGCMGLCDGTHSWDGNIPGQSGWLCRDQPGAGGDSGWANADGACGGTPTAQTKTPIYVWTSFGSGAAGIEYNYSPTHVKANRDYYYTDDTSCPSNSSHATNTCSSGVGCGTLAYLPARCTTGTAYWATNQSCTDLTDMVGANPSTPISGTLYKCTSTNTWEPYYTPYTYPHPLRGPTVQKFTGNIMIGGAGLFN